MVTRRQPSRSAEAPGAGLQHALRHALVRGCLCQALRGLASGRAPPRVWRPTTALRCGSSAAGTTRRRPAWAVTQGPCLVAQSRARSPSTSVGAVSRISSSCRPSRLRGSCLQPWPTGHLAARLRGWAPRFVRSASFRFFPCAFAHAAFWPDAWRARPRTCCCCSGLSWSCHLRVPARAWLEDALVPLPPQGIRSASGICETPTFYIVTPLCLLRRSITLHHARYKEKQSHLKRSRKQSWKSD